jgi:hypothetical protein
MRTGAAWGVAVRGPWDPWDVCTPPRVVVSRWCCPMSPYERLRDLITVSSDASLCASPGRIEGRVLRVGLRRGAPYALEL